MPAFGRDGILKRAAIEAVADYVRSLAGLSVDPAAQHAKRRGEGPFGQVESRQQHAAAARPVDDDDEDEEDEEDEDRQEEPAVVREPDQ